MSNNPVKIFIVLMLVVVPFCIGCDSMHQVGFKVPLEIMPSLDSEKVALDEREVTALVSIMDMFADEAGFLTIKDEHGYTPKVIRDQPDYLFVSYGPWFYKFEYLIDKKANLLSLNHFQITPGWSPPSAYKKNREHLIDFMSENFQNENVLIDPEPCSTNTTSVFKVKLHDRKKSASKNGNLEYGDALVIIKEILEKYNQTTSYDYFETWTGLRYSLGRMIGYNPSDRQLAINIKGGFRERYMNVEITSSICANQILDDIEVSHLHMDLINNLKARFGDDAIKELQ